MSIQRWFRLPRVRRGLAVSLVVLSTGGLVLARTPPCAGSPERPGGAGGARRRHQRAELLGPGGARALRAQPHPGARGRGAPRVRRARSPGRPDRTARPRARAARDRGGARHLGIDGRREDRGGPAQHRPDAARDARRRRDRLRALRKRHGARPAARPRGQGALVADLPRRVALRQRRHQHPGRALDGASARSRTRARGGCAAWSSRATGSTTAGRRRSRSLRGSAGAGSPSRRWASGWTSTRPTWAGSRRPGTATSPSSRTPPRSPASSTASWRRPRPPPSSP